MYRALATAATVAIVGVGAVVYASTPEPTTAQEWCRVVDLATSEEVTVPCHRDPVETTTTTVTPTSTTTTTVEPTTTLPSTTTTTVPPPSVGFVETFDTAASLDRFDFHVYHRNADDLGWYGASGGTWTGDHDLSCGPPDTQRTLRFSARDGQATRVANSVYWCPNGGGHFMTSMGDVESYSVVAFSPRQTFDSVRSVSIDVNLTDLGNRQWLKFGVVSASQCSTLNIRCMFSDVAASNLPTSLATSTRLIASWGGGASAGHPGGLKIGNTGTTGQFSAGSDKMTRHPVSLVDNGNGTVTFTVAGVSRTASGSFPACPCRVVFYDHNYTPDKSEFGYPIGHTWHWDNVVVR